MRSQIFYNEDPDPHQSFLDPEHLSSGIEPLALEDY
jgi:hypothetical protein